VSRVELTYTETLCGYGGLPLQSILIGFRTYHRRWKLVEPQFPNYHCQDSVRFRLETFGGLCWIFVGFFRWMFFALPLSSHLCDTFARSAARAPNSWNRIDLLLGCLVTHGRFLALHRQVETQAGTQAGTSERQEMLYPILLLWLWYKKQRPKSN